MWCPTIVCRGLLPTACSRVACKQPCRRITAYQQANECGLLKKPHRRSKPLQAGLLSSEALTTQPLTASVPTMGTLIVLQAWLLHWTLCGKTCQQHIWVFVPLLLQGGTCEHCAPQPSGNLGWHTWLCPCADPRLTDYDTLLANIQDLQEGRATQVSRQPTAVQQVPGSCPIDELIDESPLTSADQGAASRLRCLVRGSCCSAASLNDSLQAALCFLVLHQATCRTAAPAAP